MIRWMYVVSLKDRRTWAELRKLVGVQPITTVIRSGRLRWYGHEMRKGDEECVKKCMEYRVEGRRPAPNDTACKRWSCHIGYKLLCKLCRNLPPTAMGGFTVFGQAGHADPLDGWRCSSQ